MMCWIGVLTVLQTTAVMYIIILKYNCNGHMVKIWQFHASMPTSIILRFMDDRDWLPLCLIMYNRLHDGPPKSSASNTYKLWNGQFYI